MWDQRQSKSFCDRFRTGTVLENVLNVSGKVWRRVFDTLMGWLVLQSGL